MGLDLTWVDAAELMRFRDACWDAGGECDHQPSCRVDIEPIPMESECAYRQFDDVSVTMERLGMGYRGGPRHPGMFTDIELRERAWRRQRIPGERGIALFKLQGNDGWVVTAPEIDEALAAYAAVPERERAELETGKKWAEWIAWLRQSRQHGGFEVE